MKRAASLGRRLALVVGLLAVATAAIGVLAHAPFVRAGVLRYALALVERDYGLRLEASRLDYNLAALRIGLADLRLSAPHSPDEPLLMAEYISVSVPWRALIGTMSLDDVTLTNARVLIRRRPDGTTNLPMASASSDREPPPLNVKRIAVSQVAVDLRDEQSATFFWIPSLAILLTPEDGYLKLQRPAEFHTETQLTSVSAIAGEARFDGRALHLANVQVDAEEGDVRLDGSVTLLARDPRVDLRVRGSVDATRLTRWVVVNGALPRGTVMVDARAHGTFDSPEVALSVASDRLVWQDLAATGITTNARVTGMGAEITDLRLGFAGGDIQASARLPFTSDGAGRVQASWQSVDVAAALSALAASVEPLPSAAVSGELAGEGVGLDVMAWSGSATLSFAAGPSARGRIAVGGVAQVEIADRQWQLDARPNIGGIASVTASLRGDFDDRLAGSATIEDTSLQQLMAMLRTTGIADVASNVDVTGNLRAEVELSGRLSDPVVQGRAFVRNGATSQASAELVEAHFSGRPLQPEFELNATAPQLFIAGQMLADTRLRGRLTQAALVRPGPPGILVVVDELSTTQPDGPGQLTARGSYDVRASRYEVSAAANEWLIRATADRPVEALVELMFAGEGSVEQPSGKGHLTLENARWQNEPLGAIEASVELNGRIARLKASAPDFALTVAGRVALDSPYHAVVDVQSSELDLARLFQHVQAPVPVTGSVTSSLHAELPLEAWRKGAAALDVTSLQASAGQLAITLTAPARLRYEGERVHVERFDVDAGGILLSASGSLPVFAPAPDAPVVLVTVAGDVDAVVRGAVSAGFTSLPPAEGTGPFGLLARVTGSVAEPIVAADLDVGPGSMTAEGLPLVTGVRIRAHAEDGWIELREGDAEYQGARVAITGKAPVALLTGWPGPTGDAVVHARATSLTAAVLAPWVDADAIGELGGSVDVTLDAATPSADLAALTGELRIERLDIRIADLPVTQRVPTRIVAREGFARVEAWDWVGQGATLGVRGQVRLEDRQTALLANGVVDLRLLTPFVRSAGLTTAGRLEPRLSITGTLDSPRVDGDMLVTGGELRLVTPRVLVSDLTMRTVLTRTTARITELTGSVNGGALTGEGALEYTPDRGAEAQLSTDIRGMALEYPPGLRTEIDAALGLIVNAPPAATGDPIAGRLAGTVTVRRGAYREPLAVVGGVLAGLRARQLAAAAEPSAVLDALALDVRVVTDADLLVDNNYGRFQLGGDVRVIGTASSPGMSGRAELREGGRLFVGRNVYALNFGSIDFASPTAIEPRLNIEATTRAGGEDIQVNITGPAEGPTVDLRSTSAPELGQAEVASLLLTGRRLEDLAPGDAAFVGTQVLGNFSAEVLGFASRAVGLDTVRLGGADNVVMRRDTTAVASEIDPTTRVTFGKSLGSTVDVTFSQSLRDSDAQTWIVDYLPTRGLELRLVSNDDDLRSYGFRHDVALGGAARSTQSSTGSTKPPMLVASIAVSGEFGDLSEGQVRDQLELQTGDSVDFAAWQDDRDRLERFFWSRGYLTARIVATQQEIAEGTALLYQVTAGPRTRIEATGIELDSGLRSRLESAWSESVFDDFLVDEAMQIVRTELAASTFLQPMIDVRIREEAGVKTLQVTVERGPRTEELTVRISGAEPPLSGDIEEHVRATLSTDEILNAGAIESEIAAYLRMRGYARARVTVGATLFDDALAALPIQVDAGPVFTIGAVAFSGARALAGPVLQDAASLPEGDPYDPAVVEAARARLVALHRSEGFAAAAVTVRQDIGTSEPSVDVTFLVTEGPRQTLDGIVIEGNRSIDDDVILRTVELPLETPLRTEDLLQARVRLFDTRLFRRIDLTSEPVGTATADIAPMRLRIAVEEWPSIRLRYGFVVAEERPETNLHSRELVPGFSADATRRTLFGRAITLGTALELQRREQSGRAFASAPTLLGLPIESSVVGERSREEFAASTLVTSRTRVTWEQRSTVFRSLNLSYSYAFERNHTFDTRPSESNPLAFDITLNIARLNMAAAWDTRDDPTDTTQGLFASSTFELAPEFVGSDIRFIRQLQQAYYFRPWRRAVLASAARVGVVVPLGGQELIPSERFYAGGSRTVRGIAEDGLGARDVFGDPAGGRVMLVFNQEVRLPVYRWVRAVGFLDAGNVFTRPGDVRLTDLVGSAGLGVRIATPFALLRADFAKTIWGDSGPSTGRWTFGIGQAF